MTYFTYVKKQYSDYKEKRDIRYPYTLNGRDYFQSSSTEGIYRYSQPPKKIPSMLRRPSFMPTYLVRTSDMNVVPGSEVSEGYCTLSYSWNQSGEIVINESGKKSHRRIDEGKHRIIYPAKTVRKKARGRKRIPRKVKYVKFEDLIQEICKDFNIKYIWYDQMCINQDDDEEKHREIRQMHKIYSNSYCKIALIPELETNTNDYLQNEPFVARDISLSSLLTSQWMKRMWTLEEALMSSKMLFVGSNVHQWWYRTSMLYYPIFHQDSYRDAARVLHWAHARTSTKEHDHVFALANIFPDIMTDIKIDYKQDIHDLMIQFYSALAKHDLSILCFAKYQEYYTMCQTSINDSTTDDDIYEPTYNVPIQMFDLPSWTGIDGEHYYFNYHCTNFKNYTFNGRLMQVTCRGLTNDQHHTELQSVASIALKDIPAMPQQKTNNGPNWTLVIRVRPPGSTKDKRIGIRLYRPRMEEFGLHPETYKDIIQRLRQLSHFMSVKKPHFEWIRTGSDAGIVFLNFGHLTERLEDSASYVLLTEIQYTSFEDQNESPRCPVIKKHGNYYKAIGMCFTEGAKEFFNDNVLGEEMFEIN